jgi:hypothetical protein
MITNQRTYGEVDGFIDMLLAACEDKEMNQTLEILLSQPDEARRGMVHRLLDHCRERKAPKKLIEAIGCLLDDAVAERAYEVIYQCGRKAR